jgi:predicted Rossmann fold nucleotide-binding protein DprA/Smf involved in DNA uptake
MEPEASLSWLALTLTPGIAARLTARLLREFGTPEGVFHPSLTALEACNLPAPAAQAIYKKQTFWRAEKEVDAIRRIGCRILNCKEPEYPQSLLQIYDPPVLAMEFGREVFGVPGNVTQEMSFAPNQLIKQGAKLVTNAEDVIEELPTPVRAVLVQAEALGSEQRNLLAADGLNPIEKRIYELLSAEQARHIDDLVETIGLNSSEVLATLFDLEMKDIIRQLPGKQFTKVLL